MLLCLDSYEQRCSQLLKVLHKCCDMDVIGIILIYPHSPWALHTLRSCAYISPKPLAAVLQYINVKHETKYYLYVIRYDKSSLNSNACFHHHMICWCTHSAMYWC